MRNRIIVLAMLLIFAVAAGAQAEGAGIVAKGIKAGVNIAGHSGSDTGDDLKTRTAFVGGGFLTYAFTPALAIQPEILYSMKGYKWDDGSCSGTGKLTYLEIPVFLKYMFQLESVANPNIYAGLAPAFLLSAEEEWERPDEYALLLTDSGTEDIKDDTKSMDFGLVFGGGVDIAVGSGLLMFDVRYTMGMMKVYDTEDDWDIKNKAITIMAGYGFK